MKLEEIDTAGGAPTPFMLTPQSEYERVHGKPILLTDCEIAVILDAIRASDTSTEDGKLALDNIWRKMMGLWDTPAPYEQ